MKSLWKKAKNRNIIGKWNKTVSKNYGSQDDDDVSWSGESSDIRFHDLSVMGKAGDF